MKPIKTMLLGIAFLIVACCGVPMWVHGALLGGFLFLGGLIVGGILCIKGFFMDEY